MSKEALRAQVGRLLADARRQYCVRTADEYGGGWVVVARSGQRLRTIWRLTEVVATRRRALVLRRGYVLARVLHLLLARPPPGLVPVGGVDAVVRRWVDRGGRDSVRGVLALAMQIAMRGD